MSLWILIIVMHGWGNGVGNQGNVATSVEFSTRERCEAAATAVRGDEVRHVHTYCIEK